MKNIFNRRQFIKGTTSAAVLGATSVSGAIRGVSIAVDPADQVAATGPAAWAAERLEKTLSGRGIAVTRCARAKEAKSGDFCIVSAGFDSLAGRTALEGARLRATRVPEALALT